MPGQTLEFFFDFTSPSSYLASTRVEALAARTGTQLRRRPLLLAGVLQATGNVPLAAVPHNPAASLLGNRGALGVQDSSHSKGGTA